MENLVQWRTGSAKRHLAGTLPLPLAIASFLKRHERNCCNFVAGRKNLLQIMSIFSPPGEKPITRLFCLSNFPNFPSRDKLGSGLPLKTFRSHKRKREELEQGGIFLNLIALLYVIHTIDPVFCSSIILFFSCNAFHRMWQNWNDLGIYLQPQRPWP